MRPLKLHIVSFAIPFPVNYGGLFDIYYSIKALHEAGVQIHLHCIQYGEGQKQPILEKYCTRVDYYPRKKIFPVNFLGKPYMVASRIIPEMIATINQDDAPVLIEGVHGTGIIPYLKEKQDRRILVRLHNVEYVYYRQLARTAASWWKKIYYWSEYLRLQRWEKQLVKAQTSFCAMSLLDAHIYKEELGCSDVSYIPLFIPSWEIKPYTGKCNYCLYHGNLDVAENQTAVQWLLEEVLVDLDIPIYIAGKSSGTFVEKMKDRWPQVHWIENPTEDAMQTIIREAQVHLLPSFNATGIKIKLLNALYNGRYCIANSAMIADTGLESLCMVADTATDFRRSIELVFSQTFPLSETEKRKHLLHSVYDKEKSAKHLLELLFQEKKSKY